MDPTAGMSEQSEAEQLDAAAAAMYGGHSPNENAYWGINTVNNTHTSMTDEGLNLYTGGEGGDLSGSGQRERYSSPKFTRRSMDDSYIAADARMSRIANAEAAMRAEIYKECTFRPNIRDLPNSYGAMKDENTPFHTRVTKWQRERDLNRESKSKLVEQGEQSECTFRPKINHNSNKAIKEIRGDAAEVDVVKRFIHSNELSQQQRNQLIRDTKQKEEEQLARDCTFRPRLETVNTPVHQLVQSRLLMPLQRPDSEFSDLRSCTFTPKINKIKASMSSAKLYVSTDVVQRLTNPAAVDAAGRGAVDDGSETRFDNSMGERPVMDMASFIGSLQGKQTPSVVANASRAEAAGDASAVKRGKKFETFLLRQQSNLQRREESIQQAQRSQTPKFKPQLTKPQPSSEQTLKVDFVTRMQIEVQKRASAEQENELRHSDKECTFQPKLANKKAANVRPRSSFEMSQGDFLRKETNRSMLKLQSEQEELSNMTFQPQISSFSKKTGKSVLNSTSSDGANFMEWMKASNLKKEQRRIEILRERAEQEETDCTFKPQTTECPAYVKRIAKSMSIVKAARNSTGYLLDSEADKPQWR
ncbi:hypothetical protein B484DRAFT_445852 [Ochromonadaceae sp. CCMP2298]|nr:hypothetical protein B484DRAFT_445852 [Ochromonadaceae sp. CCMP2298]|mmetsp:Transcript_28688/g.63683  ORF Transcript_28688/g.63683 Transcript_28688/m.63683 type:complete len:588 (-) Transcript_28688:185-1948(-)|eukprot:CAMPEP_0173296886 /NCGR_PEP_ID=MMETSP1143-20121109/15201_1 /TAXON_ID=483371 /ORGANISM="non described non described, Strain CCMP2298" /LENGTH=587 /DNA_ID=CAMNT_0014236771 /DNA_START=40 /DNA_END=1803 /DNA_ORIENTATION=+